MLLRLIAFDSEQSRRFIFVYINVYSYFLTDRILYLSSSSLDVLKFPNKIAIFEFLLMLVVNL